MNQIVAFDFESNNVRVVMGEDGEPWFVAADVCAAMTISTEQTRRLDDDEKGLRTVQTPGGQQEMVTINESGLYSLILTSRKAEAKRFKRWVTREVLPSIRKTGSYAAPGTVTALPAPTQDRVTAILLIGEAVAKVPGVKHGIAMAATLTCIHENTGLSVETMRRALPACNDPLAAMNPTKLGEQIGLSARAVNVRLAALGYQQRNDRDEWELRACESFKNCG
jgi:prophage antirepressor-like protein